MPKVLSVKSYYPPEKKYRMELIGLLAMYLVKMTGNTTKTIDKPTIRNINKLVQFFNKNNSFEVKCLGGRTAEGNIGKSIILLKQEYPLICDSLNNYDIS